MQVFGPGEGTGPRSSGKVLGLKRAVLIIGGEGEYRFLKVRRAATSALAKVKTALARAQWNEESRTLTLSNGGATQDFEVFESTWRRELGSCESLSKTLLWVIRSLWTMCPLGRKSKLSPFGWGRWLKLAMIATVLFLAAGFLTLWSIGFSMMGLDRMAAQTKVIRELDWANRERDIALRHTSNVDWVDSRYMARVTSLRDWVETVRAPLGLNDDFTKSVNSAFSTKWVVNPSDRGYFEKKIVLQPVKAAFSIRTPEEAGGLIPAALADASHAIPYLSDRSELVRQGAVPFGIPLVDVFTASTPVWWIGTLAGLALGSLLLAFGTGGPFRWAKQDDPKWAQLVRGKWTLLAGLTFLAWILGSPSFSQVVSVDGLLFGLGAISFALPTILLRRTFGTQFSALEALTRDHDRKPATLLGLRAAVRSVDEDLRLLVDLSFDEIWVIAENSGGMVASEALHRIFERDQQYGYGSELENRLRGVVFLGAPTPFISHLIDENQPYPRIPMLRRDVETGRQPDIQTYYVWAWSDATSGPSHWPPRPTDREILIETRTSLGIWPRSSYYRSPEFLEELSEILLRPSPAFSSAVVDHDDVLVEN